ncbi:MAG: hypothetical protein OSW77_16125, partial [Proteobacteria bacterium]|nr:hypothetical protein [Pseudomonadota bacterium]
MVEVSAWVNPSKIASRRSAGMPIPVSRTENSMRAVSGPVASRRSATTTSPRSVNLMALPARFSNTDGKVAQQLVETERRIVQLQLAGLDLGEIQDVVEDAQQRAGRPPRFLHVVALARVQPGEFQQLQESQHGIHRRADLVAHVGHELALGPATRLGGDPGLLQPLLAQLARR